MKINVLIADDHKMIRDGFKSILNESNLYHVVAEASNGHEALKCIREQTIKLVLMDIKMPNMDGLECSRKIKKSNPNTKILILSMYHDPHMIAQMRKIGVDGYLSKGEGKADLLDALASIVQGKPYYEKLSRYSIPSSNSYQYEKKENEQNLIYHLTKRELQVLKLIVAERSNKEIANQLSVSIRTIDGHRRNLLKKTGAKNTAGVVKFGLEILKNI